MIKQIFRSRYSLDEMGKFLGSYHHTTVLYAVQNTEEKIEVKDPLIIDIFNRWNLNLINKTKND
jgi:chromosomal replication initiation ATPase DnaA